MKSKYMNDEMFNELMESMEQAAAITKGTMKPSRVFAKFETCSSTYVKVVII